MEGLNIYIKGLDLYPKSNEKSSKDFFEQGAGVLNLK